MIRIILKFSVFSNMLVNCYSLNRGKDTPGVCLVFFWRISLSFEGVQLPFLGYNPDSLIRSPAELS